MSDPESTATPETTDSPSHQDTVRNPAPNAFSSTLSVIEASPPGIREILSSVANVSGSGMYYEPSCRFCVSRTRAEAERLASTCDIGVRDIDARITQFFTSVGEDVPLDVVRHHIASHMNRGDIELRKLEYVSRLASLSSAQMTTLTQARLATAAVLECLGSVGMIVPTKGLSAAKAQEMKASVVTRLVKTWIDLMATEAKLNNELWDEGKMVAIPAAEFHKVFDDALSSARTPDETTLIVKLLDGLTNAIQR